MPEDELINLNEGNICKNVDIFTYNIFI